MLEGTSNCFQALDEAYPGDWALCLIPLQPRSKVCRQAGWNRKVSARLANGANRTEHLRRCAEWVEKMEGNLGLCAPGDVMVIDADDAASVSILLKSETAYKPSCREEGGGHFFYRLPSGVDTERLADSIDVGGEKPVQRKGLLKGYVAVWPSIHDGTGKQYPEMDWPDELPELPPWLVQKFLDGGHERADTALKGTLIPKGERRNRILRMMASLVAMEDYDREAVRVRAIDFRDQRCEQVPGDDIVDADIDGMLEWVWTKQHGKPPMKHGSVQSGYTTETGTDTTDLLESLAALFEKYMAFPSEHEARALALWCLHTYVFAVFDQSPVLCIRSPERGCGKTRLVELTNCFARDSEVFINASPAFIYRLIDDTKPTFLLDEADAIFGEKSESSEVLRAIYNAGNRRDSYVGRCIGQGSNQKPVRFNVYTPKGLAAIGKLPETIVSRSVVVSLQRKLAGEKLPSLRDRKREALAAEWNPRLVLWARQAEGELRGVEPEPPAGLEDRPADNWEVLFAIAELADGPWPDWAHEAALALQKDAVVEVSRKLDLLRDMREKLVPRLNGETTVPLQLIVACLLEDEESPWRNMYGGKQLDSVAVSRMLKPYRLSVRTVRVAESHLKILQQARLAVARPGETVGPIKDRLRGLSAEDLTDVIDRYAVDE